MDAKNDETGIKEPSSYSVAILRGLQGKSLYEGTVPAKVKAERRAANSRARVARRANRGR